MKINLEIKPKRFTFVLLNNHTEIMKNIHRKLIEAYLLKEYGSKHFSKSDLKRMEIGDDGTVYIGVAQIKTGIAKY